MNIDTYTILCNLTLEYHEETKRIDGYYYYYFCLIREVYIYILNIHYIINTKNKENTNKNKLRSI